MTVTIINDTGDFYSIGQLLDITDRREAEAHRLALALEREKVELMRVFVGNVSHDLKTPLTTIQTGLYLLKRYTDPEQRRERLDLIQQQVHRLDNLIQNLLTISRLDYQPELSLHPLNVNDLLYDIEKQFFVQIEQKQLSLELDLSANIPPINADKDEMDRVFINLIENAINYTPEGRTIAIRTYTSADHVGIDVQDSGIGISTKDLPQIFERFYRADEARSQLSSGTGLGLAIVKKIIEMHGGMIRVHSESGQGATFQVLMPVKQQLRS
jgi:two-component system phosphate regulon sensor histidine kinase PhoR